ncbi:hypothetical protein, partial [Escherichia coli]|uniref:hypothetical protein n=1 Tax=Escherichia coli TaxID=562 RepID=UPI001BFE0F75
QLAGHFCSFLSLMTAGGGSRWRRRRHLAVHFCGCFDTFLHFGFKNFHAFPTFFLPENKSKQSAFQPKFQYKYGYVVD